MISKASAILSAVALVLLQPALMACACSNCAARPGEPASPTGSAASSKSCCKAKPGSRSCCGSTDGCQCGVDHGLASHDHGNIVGQSCRCMAQAAPPIVSTQTPTIEHFVKAAGYL